MPQKIILVRHGETDYNKIHRMQGWIDVPLNSAGRLQARKVGLRLLSEKIDVIYSSDHRRAHVTALAIAKHHNLTPKKRKALRERRMGIFEGWQWEDATDPRQQLWQERELAHKNGNYDWKAEGEESTVEHLFRVKQYIKKIEYLHVKHNILIVSHGATLNRILEAYNLKNMQDGYISFGNTAITTIVNNNGTYMLETINDISHL